VVEVSGADVLSDQRLLMSGCSICSDFDSCLCNTVVRYGRLSSGFFTEILVAIAFVLMPDGIDDDLPGVPNLKQCHVA
jgi:hypothetical protein